MLLKSRNIASLSKATLVELFQIRAASSSRSPLSEMSWMIFLISDVHSRQKHNRNPNKLTHRVSNSCGFLTNRRQQPI